MQCNSLWLIFLKLINNSHLADTKFGVFIANLDKFLTEQFCQTLKLNLKSIFDNLKVTNSLRSNKHIEILKKQFLSNWIN